LTLLGGDPSLVSDPLVWRFAQKVEDHWTPEQYGGLWRRLAPRIVSLLLSADPGADAQQRPTPPDTPIYSAVPEELVVPTRTVPEDLRVKRGARGPPVDSFSTRHQPN
jgi:hypothetical protein